jgi:hypothetical protein
MSVKAARVAAQDAQDALEVARSARDELLKQRPAAAESPYYKRARVDARVADVIKAEAPAEKMLADFATLHRRFVEHRRVLEWLEGQGAIPRDVSWRAEPREWSDAGETPWKSAVAALATDADAALPI